MIRCIIGCIEILSFEALVRVGIDVTVGECCLNLSMEVSEGTYSMSEFRESTKNHGVKCHLVISYFKVKLYFLPLRLKF